VISAGHPSEVLSSTPIARVAGDEAGVMITGVVVAQNSHFHLAEVTFDGGSLWVPDQGMPIGQTGRLRILARDVSLSVAHQNSSTIPNDVEGLIDAIDPLLHPSLALVRVRCGNSFILCHATHRTLAALNLGVGSQVWCQIRSASLTT
jgi:molybdate transport system ATP-binding protein